MKGVISKFALVGALLLGPALVAAQANVPPQVALSLEAAKAKPGAAVSGSVTITFAEGLHGYQNPPSEDYMIPVAVKGIGKTVLANATYPRGIDKQVGGETKPIRVYEGTIAIPVTITAPDGTGAHKVELQVSYQQCNEDMCFGPSKTTVTADLLVEAPASLASTKPIAEKPKPEPPKTEPSPDKKEPAKVDPKGSGTQPNPEPGTTPENPGPNDVAPIEPVEKPVAISEPPDAPVSNETNSAGILEGPKTPVSQGAPTESGFVSGLISDGFEKGNYGLLLLAAILTGLALTLTPCVYPMIPVTLSFFSNQVSGSRGGRVGLGFVYMLGIAAMYGAVGGGAAALGGSVGSLFQNRWFLIGLAALMVVLALSMFDLYEIGIPRFLGKHIHGRHGALGALLMGLLVGVAAAPCAGPLVIAVATKIAEYKNVPLGLFVFTAIGMGLGLPFFALGAFSSGAKSIPKAGAWLKTVKSILGLVVLWIALDYLLKAFPQQVPPDGPTAGLIKALFLIGSAAYLILIENSGTSRAILGLKGATILACGLFAGQALESRNATYPPINWVPFTAVSFEQAKQSGKPIVIDATANWCVACHEIEKAVFKTPAGAAAMQNVVALRIDHSTGADPKYVDETSRQFGIKGLPHIEFLKPGGERVRVVHGTGDLGSPEQLERYLAEARG